MNWGVMAFFVLISFLVFGLFVREGKKKAKKHGELAD